MYPSSCDTFVALPPSTEGQRIIFGKNSDRPCDEVQEVVYFPARDYGPGEKVEVSQIGQIQICKTRKSSVTYYSLLVQDATLRGTHKCFE